MKTINITDTGCFLDNHRGHYIGRDTIQLAQEWGFIVGSFEQFAIDMYDSDAVAERNDYPYEALIELCDDAVEWLNSGQGECDKCAGSGIALEGEDYWTHKDSPHVKRCKACSGTGRGPRITGQNFPPIVPKGYVWAFEEGDFGLWLYDDEGEFVIDQP